MGFIRRAVSSVRSNVTRAASSAQRNVSNAARNVSRAASSAQRNVSQAASSFSRNVSRATSSATRNAGRTLSNAARNVSRTAARATRSAGQTFSNVTRNAQRTASTVSRNVSRSFAGAQRRVGNTLSNVSQGVRRTASNVSRNVSRAASSAVRNTQRTFSSAVRNTQGALSSASRNVNQSLTTTRNNIRQGVSQAARNTLNTAGRLGQQTLSATRNAARNTLNGYHNLIEQSYQDAKALQQSSNPFARAVGNYSVGVRDGIANLNRTVDSSVEYWRGVRGPVGRAGEFLASTGRAFTAPLRAVDHTATREQRNGALIETGVNLATGAMARLAGPVVRGLANTPVGKATVQQLSRLGNTPLGRQLARTPAVAQWLNQAPARALQRSQVGRQILQQEANARNLARTLNHFGRNPAQVRLSPPGTLDSQSRGTSTQPAQTRSSPTPTPEARSTVSTAPQARSTGAGGVRTTYEPPAGQDIQETARILSQRARQSSRTEVAVHNGVEIRAAPGERPENIVRQWERGMELRNNPPPPLDTHVPGAGEDINETARIITERARQTGRPQTAVHNGVEVRARPGERPDSVVRQWERGMELKDNPPLPPNTHEPSPGEDIRETARIITQRARQTGRPQTAVHNGVEVRAAPGERPESVVQQWERGMQRRNNPVPPRDTYVPGAGEDIRETARILTGRARQTMRPQTAVHNGVEVTVRPSDTPESVVRQWERGQELRNNPPPPRDTHVPLAGEDVRETARILTERARETGRPQTAVHNGVELRVAPGETVERVLRQYEQAER